MTDLSTVQNKSSSLLYLRDDKIKSSLNNFFEVHKILEKEIISQIENLNLGIADIRCLLIISLNPGITFNELLKSLDIRKQSLNRVLRVLIKDEFISQKINENDARKKNLLITNKAQSILEKTLKPIEKKSNLLISKFYNFIKGKIKIIGVGGVDSGKAAYDKFLLGADYLQLYTGMVFQGPNIAGMIKKDLKELLIRDGVKNFTEIVGNKTVS